MIRLAVLPAVILLIILWKHDKIEKEPIGLLVKLFVFGALTTISAIVLGRWGTNIVSSVLNTNGLVYIAIDNFILTALIEEGGKYFVLKKVTWKHPAFNYTFDAVVYAVVVSLGFATLENILYVMDGNITTAITRGLLSVPGHAVDAVFMGFYYGLAKKAFVASDESGCRINLRKALLVPTLLHGFYDFCLSTPYDIFILIFFISEIVIMIAAIKKLKKLSREDEPISA